MEKEVTLLSEGERMTPIMQKIADLKSAITRYNRVSACEKCKIAFAYGIITFADEAIEKLEAYLDHLKHNVCHDALPLGMIKEWLENTNWIDKDERLYKELHDYAGKPLSYYRVGLLLDDVNYTDTLHMYRTIVERIRRLLELLREIETILKAHNPELYENFYHNLRVNYNEKEAVDFMDNWLSHSGIPSLEKYKTFRAEEVIKFIKGDTLDCTGEPSVEEWEKVDIDGFKKQVALSCQEEEWFKKSFDERFVIFSRTVRWQGDILVPNYDCAGLFIFQHWDSLTEKDIQAIFYLDKTLELIHEEIVHLPEFSQDSTQSARDGDTAATAPALPEALATPEAMALWQKAQKAGYVDEHYQPKLSRTQSALLADAMAEQLGIKNKWKVFENLWNRTKMYKDYYQAMEQKQSLVFQDKLKMLFN